MIVRDWTDRSPVSDVMRPRTRSEIRAVVLHQTGFERPWNRARWALVHAHFVVHHDGRVTQLHAITDRMRYGCGTGNRWAINVEHEGNYPLEYRDGEPVFWMPKKFGRSFLEEAPAQVTAARELLAFLAEQVAGLMVGAHRQIELDRSGCCGPDLWREVGQWGVDVLHMPEMPVAGGRPIPDSWRGRGNSSEIPKSSIRAYTGPLEASG